MEYNFQTLEELHTALVNKEITSEELTKAVFDKIETIDTKVGAFVSTTKEEALQRARQIDEQGIDENNVLSGIPIGLKDNIVTKVGTTTAASKMLEGFTSVYDATVVERLLDAGMVPVGKLNMDEFAMGSTNETSYVQKTRNPWDLTRVPGGSSGGSAAAVAAGLIPVSLGTDTGGSVRQPASFNGLVGMKPTYGRVSRYGIIAFASSLDQVGTMSRTVKENAHLLQAISGHDENDATSAPNEYSNDFMSTIEDGVKGMKIGVPEGILGEEESADSEVRKAYKKAIDQYKELGAEIVDIKLDYAQYGVASYYILASAEAASNLQRFDGIRYGYRAENPESLEDLYVRSRSEGFGDEVKRRIMLGTFSLSSGFYDAHFEKAAKVRTLIIEDFKKAFEKVDMIITPTSLSTAYKIDKGGDGMEDPVEKYKADLYTVTVNLAGVPAISVPSGFIDGMPIGTQLIGKHFDEAKLYRAAYAFEQANDYYKQTAELKGGE